jgi:hypothetical protein
MIRHDDAQYEETGFASSRLNVDLPMKGCSGARAHVRS